MAKRRRVKIYSTQRAKDAIAFAKYAKQRGILSKQTKLHGGKYISRGVLAKIKKYEDVISSGYIAEKVPKARLEEARKAGFITVGSKVVRPPGRKWKKRILSGPISGVRPVGNKFVEVVRLPWDVLDIRQFVKAAQANPDEINKLKEPDELFVFKLYGNVGYRPFLNIETLLEYLLQYKSLFDAAGDLRAQNMDDTFEALELLRVNPDYVSSVIPSRQEREKARKTRGPRRHSERGEQYMRYLARTRSSAAIRMEKLRARMSPEKKEEYKRKAIVRAKASKARKKADKENG